MLSTLRTHRRGYRMKVQRKRVRVRAGPNEGYADDRGQDFAGAAGLSHGLPSFPRGL